MELISDILLIAGALGAAFYCVVLSRRLRRFNDLEKGVGGAIAVLSAQVDDMTKTLQMAQGVARGSNASLEDLTTRAESVSRKLEILVAALHDLPEPEAARGNEKTADSASETPASQGAEPAVEGAPRQRPRVRHDRRAARAVPLQRHAARARNLPSCATAHPRAAAVRLGGGRGTARARAAGGGMAGERAAGEWGGR